MKRLILITIIAYSVSLISCTTDENTNLGNGNNDINNENVPNNEIIQFEDSSVKKLCVTMWDTNNDNNLSFGEAKAVQTLGTVFYKNNNIRKFNELKYFTSLTDIDNETFYGCSNLTEIALPTSIRSIGDYAFYKTYVKSITIPNGVEYIGESAFNSSPLQQISLPNSVSQIGAYAFASTQLKQITLPNKVTKIARYCFYETPLTSINLPDDITEIEECAFANTPLNHLKLPKNLTTIGDYAFKSPSRYTERFQNIEIPASVHTIGYGIFIMDESDDSYNQFPPLMIYCKANKPPKFDNGEELGDGIEKIFVPSQSINEYKKSTGWRMYSDIIEGYNY